MKDARGLIEYFVSESIRVKTEFFQANADQDPFLYHNVTAAVGHWIELKLVGSKSNRDAIGARVTVKAGTRSMIREVDGGNGYAGQSTQRVHFGLGAETKLSSFHIRWPSGVQQDVTPIVDRLTTIVEPGSATSTTPATAREKK